MSKRAARLALERDLPASTYKSIGWLSRVNRIDTDTWLTLRSTESTRTARPSHTTRTTRTTRAATKARTLRRAPNTRVRGMPACSESTCCPRGRDAWSRTTALAICALSSNRLLYRKRKRPPRDELTLACAQIQVRASRDWHDCFRCRPRSNRAAAKPRERSFRPAPLFYPDTPIPCSHKWSRYARTYERGVSEIRRRVCFEGASSSRRRT